MQGGVDAGRIAFHEATMRRDVEILDRVDYGGIYKGYVADINQHAVVGEYI